jgi:acyl carrier protein
METIELETSNHLINEQGTLERGRMEPAIEDGIRAFVTSNLLYSENGFPHEDEDSFLQHGVIDSLGVLELVTFAGREFGVPIEPAEITPENFDSVRRLADFIRRKKNVSTAEKGIGP